MTAAAPQLVFGALALTLPHIVVGTAALAVVAILVWQLEPVWVFTLGIVLSVFSGNWQYMGIPGAFAPDRWLLVLGLAAVLLRARGSANRRLLRLEPIHIWLALLLLYGIASAAISGTLTSKADAFELFDDLGVLPMAVFLTAPTVFPGSRERRILTGGMVILGAYLGLTALFETLKLTALVVPNYINNPNVGIHFGRARGPFVEAVTNGVALFACILFASVGTASFRARWARIGSAAVILICTAGLLFTLQRSVWIGAAVAGAAAMLIVKRLRRWVIPTAAVAALLVVLPLLLIPGLQAKVSARANQVSSVWDRENQDRAALNMFNHRPLFGFGWAEFQPESIPYYQQAAGYPVTGFGLDVHNVYLRYAAELGLVGLTLWLGAILFTLGGAVLRRGPPMLGPWRVLAVSFAILYLIISATVPAQAFPNLVLWLLLGLAWMPARTRAPVAAVFRVRRNPDAAGTSEPFPQLG